MKPAPSWRRLLFGPGAGEPPANPSPDGQATGGALRDTRRSPVPRNGGTHNARAAWSVTLMSALEPREHHHLMSALLRRFRGLAIALAVLAITAGAVFATAPSMAPTSAPSAGQPTAEPTATPTASPKATKAPKATKSPEATETPEAPEAAETPDADAESGHGHPWCPRVGRRPDGDPGRVRQSRRVRPLRRPHGRDPGDRGLEGRDSHDLCRRRGGPEPGEGQRKPRRRPRRPAAAEKAQRQADKASAGKGKGAAKQAAKGASN